MSKHAVARMNLTRLRADQAGSSVLLALVIMVIMAGFGAVLVATANDSSADLSSQRSRSSAGAAADSAANIYQGLLNSQRIAENDGYTPTADDLLSMLDVPNGEGFAAATEVPAPFIEPLDAPPGFSVINAVNFRTVKVKVVDDNGEKGHAYWQIVAIKPPDYVVTNSLTVWFRSWLSTSVNARAQYTKVEYRPGFFSDYQMLVNGPIAFTEAVTFEGKVHSNGYDNGELVFPAPNERIWTQGTGSVSCTGAQAKITTAKGLINIGATPDPDCNAVSGGKPAINFMHTRFTLDQMNRQCETEAVKCFKTPGVYDATLSAGTVNVTGPESGSYPVGIGKSFLFSGEVRVSGVTRERLTIAAEAPDRRSGGNIRIVGDVGSFDPSNGATQAQHSSSVLGLVAQGDVILDPPGCGADGELFIHAALVAQSGGVTLDPQKATQNYQPGNFQCDKVNIKGSIASHRAPVLEWRWDSGDWFGFDRRDYNYDEYKVVGGVQHNHLKLNPPPFFPNDGRWEILRAEENNVDCLPGIVPDGATAVARGCGWT